ncbi:GerAB/ArcD/ProY family transporter [Sporomusa acidovorans]|uniref:Spore germination protein YndE n=1 Tax=Sporomusa acidovorans (strain ATCC 49682 / DSM 3132 / Mol) TaxID=1123286 RepID=A0ABZ3IWC6_SPOA4|nr:endospore germination permease [Sporomusa acidovorans]OZC15259.1 spore germination protein YndE [Sporomusa acidovorans DSM 3132]SDE91443.1 Spore germination protein [Sporomusa acidovorans]
MTLKLEKVSPLQVILLLSFNRIAIVLLWFKFFNQDVWITEILALFYLPLLCAPLLFLSKQFAQLTIIEYLTIIAGKWIGKALGVLYTVFFLFIAIIDLSLFDNIIKPINFPETPDYAIIALALITCGYGVFKGLEVITRAAELFAPQVLAVIAFYAVLQIPDMDFRVFLPILADSSFSEINFRAFNTAARMNEIVVLAMLVPSISKKGKPTTILFWAAIIVTVFSLIIIVPTLAGLGLDLAKKTFDPYYLFIKQISIYDFITRIEFLIVAAWNIGMFLKISLLLYLSTISIVQIFGLSRRKVLIIPMITIIFIAALKSNILTSVVVFNIMEYIPYINLIFMFGIPVIVLTTFFLKKIISGKTDFTKA